MVVWAQVIGGGGALGADWFALRFADARAAIPDAEFDTVIPAEFAETITAELVDTVGTVSADPVDFYSGGVVAVSVGDLAVTPCQGRLQLTGSPSHVGAGKSWYAASLVRAIRPADDEMGDTLIDCIGLWSSDENRIGLGLFGNGSGGSTTNWVGYAVLDGSFTTSLGPALDGEESPVWHLFEAMLDVDAGTLTFRLDGTAFAGGPIAAEDVPTGQPLRLSMISQRTALGSPSATNYDKACVVVTSPRVGETS